VLEANTVHAASGKPMDLARYELLTMLDSALSDRLQVVSNTFDEASLQRAEKASESVQAKRYRERVGEHLDGVRLVAAHERAAKAQEEGVETWLESRGEGA
jgi:hypothetical protein